MTTTTSLPHYLAELRDVLDRDGVEPTRREQVVAEVAAHVADTGEDPVDAFGPPGVYAAQYAPAQPAGSVARQAWSWRVGGIHPVAAVLLAGLALLVCVPGLVMLVTLLAAVTVSNPIGPAAGLLAGLAILAALPYLAHRARRPMSSRWTSLAVALAVLGAVGAWTAFVAVPVSLAFAEGSGENPVAPSFGPGALVLLVAPVVVDVAASLWLIARRPRAAATC